jgi:hypothetical protein
VPGHRRRADERGDGCGEARRPHLGGHTRPSHGHAQQEDDHTRRLQVSLLSALCSDQEHITRFRFRPFVLLWIQTRNEILMLNLSLTSTEQAFSSST